VEAAERGAEVAEKTSCCRARSGSYLSRDSRLGQRNDRTLAVQVFDSLVNGPIEFSDASECLMSEIARLQVVPDDLDVV
jgi:hypothetical protein